MTTTWIRATEVRPGERVKVPRGGSHAYHATRDDAERDDAPFRRVLRVRAGAWFADGTPYADAGETSVWFESGSFHMLPAEARVLREQA